MREWPTLFQKNTAGTAIKMWSIAVAGAVIIMRHGQLGGAIQETRDEVKVGKAHPAQPNMMKYAGTELNKRRHELMMAAGGSTALEWTSEETDGGKPARNWLRTKANSIEGGTSEVMLNVISKRILELPGA